MESLLPQISSKHFKQIYSESFLAFKDEPVTQLLIQFIKLIPAARMRSADSKLADRIEQTLRILSVKFTKKPKSESVVAAINEASKTIKSEEFMQAIIDF
jgi:23S rRNA pseudoU1915 N3-methylase RlmH